MLKFEKIVMDFEKGGHWVLGINTAKSIGTTAKLYSTVLKKFTLTGLFFTTGTFVP